MADLKISQLTGATTPLAGTEVLPIVQGGTTKKVATDDLTVKNIRSNTTTGLVQITGPAAGQTRVMTTPDANFTAARTDAAQSFTGNQTLADGNLVIGTFGKGISFNGSGNNFGGFRVFGWGNVSSIAQDLATLFDNVTFTNRGLSIEVQVMTQSTGSAATAATFVGLRTGGGTWTFTAVNAATSGGPTITPSGSGTTLTLSFSAGGQFGLASVRLISQP